MVRIAICEDNRDDCHTLNNLLTDFFAERAKPCSVQVFESGEALLDAFRQADFDICLIDLLLPGMDGMETACRIRSLESACSIIFTTITDAYAVSGYRVAAVAYLLKPIVPQDLAAALLRCPSVAPKPPEARLSLAELNLDIPVRSVRYVEVFGNRLIVHTVGHAISGYATLSAVERQLDGLGFVRISRFYLVNMRHIVDIKGDLLTLSDNTRLTISRRRCRKVADTFRDYLMRQLENTSYQGGFQ